MKFYPISILRPDMKSLHPGASKTQIERKIKLFLVPIVISKFQSHWGDQNEYFGENKLYHVNQREKTHQNRGHSGEI